MLKIFQIFFKIYLHYVILLIKKIKKISKKEIYFFHFFSTFKKWVCLKLIYLLRIKRSFSDFLIWYCPNQKFSKYLKKFQKIPIILLHQTSLFSITFISKHEYLNFFIFWYIIIDILELLYIKGMRFFRRNHWVTAVLNFFFL